MDANGEDMVTLTLRETAERHDISPSYLSERVRNGEEAKGMDLSPYAQYGENGRIDHFAFPPEYTFPDEANAGERSAEQRSEREDVRQGGGEIEWLDSEEAHARMRQRVPIGEHAFYFDAHRLLLRSITVRSDDDTLIASTAIDELTDLICERGMDRALEEFGKRYPDRMDSRLSKMERELDDALYG